MPTSELFIPAPVAAALLALACALVAAATAILVATSVLKLQLSCSSFRRLLDMVLKSKFTAESSQQHLVFVYPTLESPATSLKGLEFVQPDVTSLTFVDNRIKHHHHLCQQHQQRELLTIDLDRSKLNPCNTLHLALMEEFHLIMDEEEYISNGRLLLGIRYDETAQRLIIHVVRAEKLPAQHLVTHTGTFSLQSNPLCVILFNSDNNEDVPPAAETECLTDSTHPAWQQTIRVENFPPSRVRSSRIRFRVLNVDQTTGFRSTLGETIVLLSKFSQQELQLGLTMWKSLQVFDPAKQLTHGSIKFGLRYLLDRSTRRRSIRLRLILCSKMPVPALIQGCPTRKQLKFRAKAILLIRNRRCETSKTRDTLGDLKGSISVQWRHKVTFPLPDGADIKDAAIRVIVKSVNRKRRSRPVGWLELSRLSQREDCRKIWDVLESETNKGTGRLWKVKLNPPNC